ncbi:hypothetical protein E8M24_30035 [Bacillus thuringiensis]|nr:hypothetical protein E8M24_30035 [Bacillus thuringiensis]PGP36648.1 hypothetical protein CN993_30635 [Bacillus thuringiensis]
MVIIFKEKRKVRQRYNYKKNIAYQRGINIIHPIVRAVYFKVFMISPFRYRMHKDGNLIDFPTKILLYEKK